MLGEATCSSHLRSVYSVDRESRAQILRYFAAARAHARHVMNMTVQYASTVRTYVCQVLRLSFLLRLKWSCGLTTFRAQL